MDRETRFLKELATAAIDWYANQNDAQLAERIEALCNRFGRSDLLLYSTPTVRGVVDPSSQPLHALLAWEMNDTGRTMHDVIVSLLDSAGITYNEAPPGNLRLRFDSVTTYDTFMQSLEEEMLEDSWPAGFTVVHAGPYS